MRICAVILLVALVGGAGCFNNGQSHVDRRVSNADRVEKKKQIKELNQEKTMKCKELTSIAQAFLKEKGLEWGPPINIIRQERYGRYMLVYSTPKSEVGKGGTRGVFICDDGYVILKPQL